MSPCTSHPVLSTTNVLNWVFSMNWTLQIFNWLYFVHRWQNHCQHMCTCAGESENIYLYFDFLILVLTDLSVLVITGYNRLSNPNVSQRARAILVNQPPNHECPAPTLECVWARYSHRRVLNFMGVMSD